MRDKKLSDKEEAMRAKIDNPDVPNDVPGTSIFAYKLYLSLLEQVVRIDKEVEALQAKK